ncbi:MAG: GtrA family protein [Clostridia bacterium]|nr:GtrA family protein [Clostridia bacterium]
MKKKEFLRTVKYALVAASAGIIQIGTFTLLNEVVFRQKYYWASFFIALLLSVLWNFTINRRYTFKSASNVPKAMLLVLAYYAVYTPLSLLLEDYLTDQHLLSEIFHLTPAHRPNWNEYLVTAINMIINFVTEFLFQRFVVFRDSIDTNDLARKENGEKK